MSLIGPRPVILSEQELIQLRQKLKADALKPGITGLAQINGRDSVQNDAKAHFDSIYAKNVSFRTDLTIFFKTILKVVKKDGIVEKKETVKNWEKINL